MRRKIVKVKWNPKARRTCGRFGAILLEIRSALKPIEGRRASASSTLALLQIAGHENNFTSSAAFDSNATWAAHKMEAEEAEEAEESTAEKE